MATAPETTVASKRIAALEALQTAYAASGAALDILLELPGDDMLRVAMAASGAQSSLQTALMEMRKALR